MSPEPKVPRRPPERLVTRAENITQWSGALWRIHRTGGAHPSAWNAPRTFGPLRSMRWDPHPEPVGPHPTGPGVSYCAATSDTAFAEVFQQVRRIDLSGDRALSGWSLTSTLRLLDLVGSDWALRNGAAHMLTAAPRSTCRAWTRAIHDQLAGRIDGILAPSTLTGDPVVVVFDSGISRFPAAPHFSRLLDHVDVQALAIRAADRFDWPLA
ncbi:MAG: RES family NAD+ phosphorylase [Dermabacteraceae bacterium]